MKTLKGAATLAAILFAIAGCDDNNTQNPAAPPATPNYASEYQSPSSQPAPKVQEMEGKIEKVQPGHVSYVGVWDTYNNGCDNGYGARSSSNHEFEYVFMTTEDGKHHVLVFPYSRGIMEHKAQVKFRELPNGRISVDDFIKAYMSPNYYTDDHFDITAEGVITGDGIQYQE
jgi:hypothetical protein